MQLALLLELLPCVFDIIARTVTIFVTIFAPFVIFVFFLSEFCIYSIVHRVKAALDHCFRPTENFGVASLPRAKDFCNILYYNQV